MSTRKAPVSSDMIAPRSMTDSIITTPVESFLTVPTADPSGARMRALPRDDMARVSLHKKKNGGGSTPLSGSPLPRASEPVIPSAARELDLLLSTKRVPHGYRRYYKTAPSGHTKPGSTSSPFSASFSPSEVPLPSAR